MEEQRNIFQYLSELNEQDKQAYHIAFNHLETSFNITRSNGYNKWLLTQQTKLTQQQSKLTQQTEPV